MMAFNFLKVRGFKIAAIYLTLFSFPLVSIILIENVAPSLGIYALIVAIYCYIFYGFTINDYFDSRILKEKNKLSEIKEKYQIILICGSVALGLSMFIFIGNWACFAVYVLSIIYGLSYSVPKPRLKNKPIHGVVNIILTECLSPLVMILIFFNFFNMMGLLFIVLFSLFGLTNILNHYMVEYETDEIHGVKTLSHILGKQKCKNLLDIFSYSTVLLFFSVLFIMSLYIPLILVSIPLMLLPVPLFHEKKIFPRVYDIVITRGFSVITIGVVYVILLFENLGFWPLIASIVLIRIAFLLSRIFEKAS